jgi:hypothetical protein
MQNPAAQNPVAQNPTAQNRVALSVWLGMALYAAIGLFGIIVLHDAAPMRDATSGYGISVASAETTPDRTK